jgi:hypothetical protein
MREHARRVRGSCFEIASSNERGCQTFSDGVATLEANAR